MHASPVFCAEPSFDHAGAKALGESIRTHRHSAVNSTAIAHSRLQPEPEKSETPPVFLPPLTGCDDDRISQWAFDLLEALPNAHYNAFVYVLALLREVLAKSWQTTAATRLAAVARDAFLPGGGEPDARAHVFAAVRFLLTSNL